MLISSPVKIKFHNNNLKLCARINKQNFFSDALRRLAPLNVILVMI